MAATLAESSLSNVAKLEDVEMASPPPSNPQAKAEEDDGMADLFGDDAAEIVHHESSGKASEEPPEQEQRPQLTAEEEEHRRAMEYLEDEDNEPDEIHVREAAVSIPNIPRVRSSDGNFWVLRMPNFIKLDSRPFHPQTYVGPEQHDDDGTTSSVREKSMSIKLQVENTVRWRWAKDENGNDIKQSNSRIVRWSDGTQTLLLGKELFEIQQTIDTSASTARQTTTNGTSSTPDVKPPKPRTQGLTYLVAQHPRSTILQAEVPITGTLTMRPIGMQSETHQMLVRAVGQKHNKVARLRMAPDPVRDPEREKMELLKSQNKKPRKRRERDDDDLGGTPRKRGVTRRRDNVFSDDEEEEEARGYASDGDSDGTTPRKAKPNIREKRTGEYQTDDFLVSDEEDEDGDGYDDDDEVTPRKRKTRAADEDEGGRDSLDEMEEKIEKQKQESRRKKKRTSDSTSGGAAAAENPDVAEDPEDGQEDAEGENEVESEERDAEEEEDEVQIRKAGTGARRKLVVEEEEEDE